MSKLHVNPRDLFPDRRELGSEPGGNEILVDLSGGQEGFVYGLWHDPAIVVVIARSEAEFRGMATGFVDTGARLPEQVRALASLPNAAQPSSLQAALSVLPPSLAPWLRSFDPNTRFVDVRQGQSGSGFKAGPEDTFAKHPEVAVFAIHTPLPGPNS